MRVNLFWISTAGTCSSEEKANLKYKLKLRLQTGSNKYKLNLDLILELKIRKIFYLQLTYFKFIHFELKVINFNAIYVV